MSSAIYIFLGLLITFLVYFLITWGISSLYFWVSREQVGFAKEIKIAVTLAAVGFLSGILLMIALSSTNIYVFAFLITLISLSLYWLALKFLWKYTGFDASVISITLAIIINPAWLRLAGIL